MKGPILILLTALLWGGGPVLAQEVTCRELLQVDYELASYEFYRQHRGLNPEARSTEHLLEILTPFLEALARYQAIERKIAQRYPNHNLEALLEQVCDRDTHLRLAQERARALKWVEGRPPKIPGPFNRMRAQITDEAQKLALRISRELTSRESQGR